MVDVRLTETFDAWLEGLRDVRAKAIIARRLDGARFGNLGDVVPVGGGVSEMRIHYGPGYRLYLVQRGPELIVMLGGGDKASQKRDIRRAKALAEELD